MSLLNVMDDSEIDDEVEIGVRKLEARDVALEELRSGRDVRPALRAPNHPRIEVDADVTPGCEQIMNDPCPRALPAANLEHALWRAPQKAFQARCFVASLNECAKRVVHRPVLEGVQQHVSDRMTFVRWAGQVAPRRARQRLIKSVRCR